MKLETATLQAATYMRTVDDTVAAFLLMSDAHKRQFAVMFPTLGQKIATLAKIHTDLVREAGDVSVVRK